MHRHSIVIGLGGAALLALTIGETTLARPRAAAQDAAVQQTGKPQSCLDLARIDHTRVRDDQTIDFFTHGGKVYRNRLPYSCPSLGIEERFSYSTGTQELCSVDSITVLLGGGGLSQGASCGLGDFVPVSGVSD